MADLPHFTIPDPKEPDPEKPIDQQFLVSGAFERQELTQRYRGLHRHYNWVMRFVMKPALFLFVLWLNYWWDANVMRILWASGRDGGRFHLGDSVLIALITTSVANFLLLIHIVAKHLFPEHEKASREQKSN